MKPVDEPLYPHRSKIDRRHDVTTTLTAHPEYSDRRIAWICAVSRELVSTIRRELVRKSLIASRHALHRIGADGKHYSKLPRAREATHA